MTADEAVSAAQLAYDSIRAQIISGALPPGARLPEVELGASMGLSRTPVREALRRLHVEGFVTFEWNRGAQVTVYSEQDTQEIFQLRVNLEGLAARLAARRITPDVLARLRQLSKIMDGIDSTTDGVDEMTEANNEFHRLVAEASGNRRLSDIRAALVSVPIVRRTLHAYVPAALDRSRAHHRELIDALTAGNEEWAESIARAHILAAQVTTAGDPVPARLSPGSAATSTSTAAVTSDRRG